MFVPEVLGEAYLGSELAKICSGIIKCLSNQDRSVRRIVIMSFLEVERINIVHADY